MRNALQNNRITGEEYSAYMETYYRAQIEHFAYSKLNAQCQRIDMLAENGKTAQILYDSGWQYAFSWRFDMVLAVFFLLQSYALPQPTFSASIIFDSSGSLGIALFIHSCVKILVTILFVTSVVHLARGLRRTYLVLPVGLLILAAFGFVTNL